MSDYKDYDWSELEHAYGDASDVPGLLDKLQSDDDDEAKEALYELCSNIWHQGTVYEATVKALPFLIDIYRAQKVKNLEGLALLIIFISCGKGYHQVHSQGAFKDSHLDDEGELKALLKKEDQVVNQIRKIMIPNFDILISYMDYEEENTRLQIVTAISHYPEQVKEHIAAIQAASKKETNDDVIAVFRDMY